MITECTKCGTTTEAKLDVNKNKVFCMNPKCGAEIYVTDMMKNLMKLQGDIIRNDKNVKIPEGGMRVECSNSKCGKSFSAVLNKKDEEVYCPYCGERFNISPLAKGILRENGIYEGSQKVQVIEDNIPPQADENGVF
jgi:DNA-directed RNA polymerase subunit RPC12/RpoP